MRHDDLRRNACPSLAAPMATGDGLLVRLDRPLGGYSPTQLIAVARMAARTGNGAIDLSSRGRLQIRGVTAETLGDLADTLAALGVVTASASHVETNALLGLDPTIDADTAMIGDAITAYLDTLPAGALAPKLSIVVDGGGLLPLSDLSADLRLTASNGRWFVAVAGDARSAAPFGSVASSEAATSILALIDAMMAIGPRARGGDLRSRGRGTALPGVQPSGDPIGRIDLADGTAVLGLGIPYGQIDAAALIALCATAARHGAGTVRLSPGRALLFAGLRTDALPGFEDAARIMGLITTSTDPRRRVSACVGRPACASGLLATRAIADMVSAMLASLPDDAAIHLSGCVKGCAHHRAAALTLVGTARGCGIIRDGCADAIPCSFVAEGDLPSLIAHGRLLEGIE